jgi:hypothetical protein
MGAPVEDLQTLERYTLETRAYLEALVRLGGSATGGDMRQAAEAYLHRPLDPHKLPNRMEPLVSDGVVKFTGKKGDKTSRYAIVDKKKGELLAEVSADLAIVGAVPDEVFEHDFAWIVERLADKTLTTDEKGRALEVLAAMICWKLGLRHVVLRDRREFEVDVVAERLGAGYQAWSAQCKAFGTTKIRGDYILREFGIGILNRYDVLMFVTTTAFTRDAVAIAERIMRETSVQVILVNGSDLRRIAQDESELFRLISARSEQARELRYGDPPVVIFENFDASKDWLLQEMPTAEEVWLYLERRDVHVERSFVPVLLIAWLESKRGAEDFNAEYLERLK